MIFGRKKKYYFSCSSIGMSCGFEVRSASTEDEVIEIIKVHGKRAHNLTQISEELLDKIKRNIVKK
jgi:predicted small metal-binding protein